MTSLGEMSARGRAWAARRGRDDRRVRWVCFCFTQAVAAHEAHQKRESWETSRELHDRVADLLTHLRATDLGPGRSRAELMAYAAGVRDHCRAAAPS